MISRITTLLLTLACAGVARATYSPVTLTPGSYTYKVVVPAGTAAALPYCITATSDAGRAESANTLFEQGLYARAGQSGGNMGIPLHNTVFTNLNNTNVQFLMPPSYLTNNDLQIDTSATTGTLLFNSPVTATNLAILSGGGGAVVVNYIVTHTDSSTDSGSISCSDWLTPGTAQIAWGANGSISTNGTYTVYSTSAANSSSPYIYSYYLKVSGTVPITSVTFNYASGGHEGNFYAVSGKAPGSSTWTPIPLGGFNRITTIPAAFPLTATMDQGTNTSNNGNLATWFEKGYDSAFPAVGLPASGSTFTSQAQPTHQYTMGVYTNNCAILIDANHLVANITPATPAPLASFAFLTAGGNVDGNNVMTNLCILQHTDGVQETNLFYGYDWFNGNQPVAYNANGRVNMYSRTLNNINNSDPRLFESFFVLNDVGSPVTNIVVKFQTAPEPNSTTFIMAVSASAGGVPPVINAGASPATQTLFPTQTATFTVQASGTPPTTNTWEIDNNGVYTPLVNGPDANGSTISGAGTTTLTISDLGLNDGGTYVDVVANAFGSVTSAPAVLSINTSTPVAPFFDSQNPSADLSVLSNHIRTTTFSVDVDSSCSTPLSYQWFNGSTPIPGATGATYVNVDTNDATISCTVTNFAGSASSDPINLTLIAPTYSPFQAAIMASHPVAFWQLSETSGTTAYDYASTNDGTYLGGITLGQPGLPSYDGIRANVSVGFDGSTAYVDVPVNNLDITGPITLIQWVQWSGGTAIQTTLGHSDESYRLDVAATGDPHFADEGPDVVSSTSIGDGNWHLLVGVYDGVYQHLYVDGQPASGSTASTPAGSLDDVWIGASPDYPGERNFSGYSADVAILPSALTAAQVSALYSTAGVPPTAVITPASPAVYAGASITLTAQLLGSTPTSLQWYFIDNSNNSNNITGATNASYTLSNAPLANNGYAYGINVANSYGTNTASVTLAVQNGPAYLNADITPLAGEAYVGAPVTYTVGGLGTAPIYYQWLVDGNPVSGATNAVFTIAALCGQHSIQVAFTNAESGGTPITSSLAELQGDLSPTNLTFNSDGTGWQLNTLGVGSVPSISGNILELTDDNGDEASSAFYMTPQYVSSFTASFTYTANGSADGACFIVENNPAGDAALGTDGNGLGYFGITNSIALEFNLYQLPGIAQGTNGNTYGSGFGAVYVPAGPVSVSSGDPINVVLNWEDGVLSVTLTDADTLATYSTSYTYGPINGVLGGGNLGYIGFSGGAGSDTSIQTISNFEFNSVIPPVSLSFTPVATNSFTISWPAADPTYQLQATTNLAAPVWVAAPPPIVVNGLNTVKVNVTGAAQKFYQLVRIPTCD